jgi:tape measure domain-containing protein
MEGGDFSVMASVDNRVVAMSFQSAAFVSGVAAVLMSLNKLKLSVSNLKGAGKALGDLDSAGKKVDLSGLARGVDEIGKHFTTLGTIATTALATIASMAVQAGTRLLKSLTLTPILSGLNIYGTKLQAIQTILANTMGQSGSNIHDVTKALDELNGYANQTIFRFGDMAHSIGLFTAAGVGIKDSVSSIKGLANIAALSGASTEQAASAMYQMSQAIAAGSIKLEDWNSIVNAGMGGKVFQNALIQMAKVHGVAVDQMIKKDGSFRLSLQEGWLTSKIMTDTLKTFTGDLSEQQLKAMGFTDKETQAILKQAQAAVNAATKVKTVSQLMEVMADSIATAWSKVFEAVLGNLPQATTLLTGISAALSKVFVAPVQHLGDLLQKWNELGGRKLAIEGLTQAFRLLGQIIAPIKQAFRDVFPPTTAQRLVDMTKSFHDFIMGIHISSGVISNLRSIFGGLFSAVKIVWDVFKGVVGVIGQVIHAATGLGGGILGLAAHFGDFLTNTRETIEKGNGLTRFFQGLGTVLSAPVKVLSSMASILGALGGAAAHALAALQPFFNKVAEGFSALGNAIVNAIRSGDFSKVMTILNQGIFGAILLAVHKFIGNFGKAFAGGFGLKDKISGIFGSLQGALVSLQANLNSKTLERIAIAIALLTASIIGLSLVNPTRLVSSLTALTTMFGELLGAMAIVAKISSGKGIIGMGAIAGSLILLATALLILSGAVAVFAQFSWSELAKGLTGIAVSLGLLVGAVKLLAGNTAGVIAAAFAMDLMGAALILMGTAVRILAGTDWGGILKGLVAVGALLGMLALFNAFGGVQLVGTAAAMIGIGIALNIIAAAVGKLGGLGWGEIAKGMVALAGSLVIIAGAMALMSGGFAGAAALLVMAGALVILSHALNSMGSMSWSEIAKSLVELAGAMIILAGSMALMTGGIAGAAALLVISGALAVLTPVLIALGGLSWGQLLTSLVALAAALTLLGLASLVLAPLAPAMIAVAGAMFIFGAALVVVGGGIFLLGAGLTAIGVAVMSAGAGIVSFVSGILNLIPQALQRIGQGIVLFAGAIAKGGAAITAAFVTLLTSLLNAIIKVVPLAGRAVDAILNTMLNLVLKYTPRLTQAMITLLLGMLTSIANSIGKFVQKGSDIIVGFLNGVARNAGRLVQSGVNVIVAFINGIGSQLGRVTQAGINMVINLVNGLANQINNSAPALRAAGLNLAIAIVDGITFGLASAGARAISAAASLAGKVLGALGGVLGIHSPSTETYAMATMLVQGLVLGLENSQSKAADAADSTGKVVVDTLSQALAAAMDVLDLEPVITPVIDLSLAKKGFDDLSAMLLSGQLKPVATAAAASSINVGTGAAAGTEGPVQIGGTNISYVQNNTSPKALSAAEIYRQTRNQLSIVRGALPG